MKKAVHFGAGNIGRGFIGLLLSKAGYEVTYVDKVSEIIDAINDKKSYTVMIAGEKEEKIMVENIRGILSSDEQSVSKAIMEANIITTAVGPEVLNKISLQIAAGLKMRLMKKTVEPLNIIACENKVGASEFLKHEVFKFLTPAEIAAIEPSVGFPNAGVDRIVPPQKNDDILSVMVEPYFEWVVDKKAFKGAIPEIPGMRAVEDLQAYVERKIFTLNTGHAVAAYLGYLKGYKTIQESLKDSKIFDTVKGAMEESGKYLTQRFGFSVEKHEYYIQKTLFRFQNPALNDEVVRVGRKPLRKLGPEDRLVFPAVKALELGENPVNLASGIAAALEFDYKGDEEACIIQHMIKTVGIDETLYKICGISPEHPLNKMVKYALVKTI